MSHVETTPHHRRELAYCLCEAFRLWYVTETGLRICGCGHPAGQHLDGERSCVGEVWLCAG